MRWNCKIKLKCVEDAHFHFQHFFCGVGLVSDLDEVTHLGRLDLLVFARDEHGGNPDQLQLGPVHVGAAEVPVDGGDGEAECLG